MSDIFISYATEDRKVAQRLARTLINLGWSVWWDRKIPPGKSFDEVIEKELARCHCVVVLWSKISVHKRWVKLEARGATKRGVLIPVLIDKVVPPFEFSDVQAASMSDWDGSSSHSGFKLLLDVIQQRTGRRPQPHLSQNRKPDLQPHSNNDHKPISRKPTLNWKIVGIGVGACLSVLAVVLVNSLMSVSEPVARTFPIKTADKRTFPVKIISYNSTFVVYQNNKRRGVVSPSFPLEFKEARGPLELECRRKGQRKLLKIFVGANKVWACKL
jgi:TIR domain